MKLSLAQTGCTKGDACCGACANKRDERRREDRLASDAGVKVFDRRSRRYYPGRALNLSGGGALIELHSPRPIAVGQALDLFVSGDSTGVAPSSAFRSATVVRLDSHQSCPLIALRVAPAASQARSQAA